MFQFLRAIIPVAGIVATYGTSFAAEDPFSANAVMLGCREAENYGSYEIYKRGLCMGIVSAILFEEQAILYGNQISAICLPPGVTQFQAIRIVVKYIDDRPTRLNEDIRALAREALRAAWPCKKWLHAHHRPGQQ